MRRPYNKERDAVLEQYSITKPFVFSWTRCVVCRDEVRWERCYRYISGHDSGIMAGKTRYVCNACATSVKDVHNIIKERRRLLRILPPPTDMGDDLLC